MDPYVIKSNKVLMLGGNFLKSDYNASSPDNVLLITFNKFDRITNVNQRSL